MAELNEAQALLRETARRALASYPGSLDLGRRDTLPAGAAAAAAALAAEQGWTAIRVPEEAGGLGLGLAEVSILAHEVGRSLAPGPLLAAVAVVPELAREAATPWLDELAGAVMAGERRVAVAFDDGRGDPEADLVVPDAAGATDVLLLASPGGPGTRILHLDRRALLDRQPLDPTSLAAVLPRRSLDGAARDAAEAAARLQDLLLPAHLWIAAELAGIAERAGEIAVAHAKERRQFGAPIGSYQAVKHRMVDDYILAENARTLVGGAAQACDAGDAGAPGADPRRPRGRRPTRRSPRRRAASRCTARPASRGSTPPISTSSAPAASHRPTATAQASRAAVARHLIDHAEPARA